MNTQNTPHKKTPLASAIEFAGFNDWFEIFKAGDHVDSKGKPVAVSTDDLDSIVNNFTAGTVPLVIGHPQQNHPAWGWGAALKREGDVLLAKASDVISEFEEAVKKKMYPKRSVSIVPVEGGGYRLRHIGFLGAKPPAVKGLADLAFTEDDNALEFVEAVGTSLPLRTLSWAFDSVARLFRKQRENIIAKESIEVADQLMPDWQITEMSSLAEQLRKSAESAEKVQSVGMLNQFNEPIANELTPPATENPIVTEKTFSQAEFDAAVAAKQAENEVLQKQLQTKEFAAKAAEANTFVQGLVKEGKLSPADTTGAAEFMASLNDDEAQGFEFSEGEGETAKPVKMSQKAFFTKLLGNAGKTINFGEQHGANDVDTSTVHNFSAPDGAVVSPEADKLHGKIMAYAKQHNCDYSTAVKAVS